MKEYDYMSNIWKINLSMFIARLELVAAIFVLFLLSKDLSMLEVMVLQSFFTIIMFALEIPSGVFADLYGRKNTIMFAFLIGIVGFSIYPMFDSFFGFLIPEALIAIAISMKSGADSALIYDSLRDAKQEKRFEKLFGTYLSLQTLALGIGTAIGGFTAQKLGFGILFQFTAFMYLVSFLIFLSVKETNHHKRIIERKYFKHMKEGIRITLSNKIIRASMIYISVAGAFTYLLFMLMQPYLQDGGLSYTYIGFGMSGFFIFNAIGFHFSEQYAKRFKSQRSALLAILITIGLLYILIGISNVWIGMIMIFALMFISAIKEIMIENQINKEADSEHRATIISIKNMALNIVYSIFAPLIGYAAGIYTIRGAMILSGILILIFWAVNIFLFKDAKRSA